MGLRLINGGVVNTDDYPDWGQQEVLEAAQFFSPLMERLKEIPEVEKMEDGERERELARNGIITVPCYSFLHNGRGVLLDGGRLPEKYSERMYALLRRTSGFEPSFHENILETVLWTPEPGQRPQILRWNGKWEGADLEYLFAVTAHSGKDVAERMTPYAGARALHAMDDDQRLRSVLARATAQALGGVQGYALSVDGRTDAIYVPNFVRAIRRVLRGR